MSSLVHVFLAASGVYALAGLLFAVPFVVAGAARVDATARVATWGFRVIIVPGVVALWPWLAWRWMTRREMVERNAHRDLARDPRAKGDAPEEAAP